MHIKSVFCMCTDRRTTLESVMKHQIIVGNIGTVIDTDCEKEARGFFDHYMDASMAPLGRAAGESVCWMIDDDIHSFRDSRLEYDRDFLDSV